MTDTKTNLKLDLDQFTGSEHFYKHLGGRNVMTDGVVYLAHTAGAHWLTDVVFSHTTCTRAVAREDFVVITLTVKNDKGRVVFDDGNGNKLKVQLIPYTDFPLDTIKLYAVRNELKGMTLMLPSEY